MANGAVLSRKIGSRYVAHKVLGRGASGTVWEGDGPDGPVAIKLLREDLASDQVLVARFVQERTVLTSLEHPNIVGVHDLVVDGSDLALVMDLVYGSDLRHRLERERVLAPQLAVAIVADVAEGLAAAHAEGVIHRDVKPENILLDAGGGVLRARLTDFGIARLLDSPRRTRATRIVGTPDYLAPEVIEGCQPTAAVDIYALGTVLFELLTGWTPFGGAHPAAVLRRHVTEPAPEVTGLPEPLAQLISSCLSKAPAVRLTAGEVAVRLRAILPSVVGMAPLEVPDPAAGDPQEQGPVQTTGSVAVLGTPDVDESNSDTHVSMRRPAGHVSTPELPARRGGGRRILTAVLATLVVLAAAGAVLAFTMNSGASGAPGPTTTSPAATGAASHPATPSAVGGGPPLGGTLPRWKSAVAIAGPVSTTISGGVRAVTLGTTSYVFARGADKTILYATYDGANFASWQRIPNLQTEYDPAVVAIGNGQLDLFAVDTGHLLEERTFTGGSWSPRWTAVDPTTRLGGSPAAAAVDANHIAVVAATATTGTLSVAIGGAAPAAATASAAPAETWQPFQPLPTPVKPAFAPALTAGPGGFTAIVVRSGDNVLEQIAGTPDGTWQPPAPLGMTATSRPEALTVGQSTIVLAQVAQNGSGSAPALTVPGTPTRPVPASALGKTPADTPATDVASDGRVDLYTLGQDGNLYHART